MRQVIQQIKEDIENIIDIPEEYKTDLICNLALTEDPMSLCYIPNYRLRYDMCLHAVKRNGAVLEFIPEEYKTYEICWEAIHEYPEALQFVPDKYKNTR